MHLYMYKVEKERQSDIDKTEFHLERGRFPNFKYFVTRRLYIMFLPERRNARRIIDGHPASARLPRPPPYVYIISR